MPSRVAAAVSFCETGNYLFVGIIVVKNSAFGQCQQGLASVSSTCQPALLVGAAHYKDRTFACQENYADIGSLFPECYTWANEDHQHG